MIRKRRISIGFVGILLSFQATGDEIGGGKPILDPYAAPAEESGTSESSTGSFFNELLEIFELESSD